MSKMIFIVGNSRSGTTMVGRVLGNHSKVNTFGELHFFEHQISASQVRKRLPSDEKRLSDLLQRLLTTARDGFFKSVKKGEYLSDAKSILSGANALDEVSIYERFLKFETKRNGKEIPCEQTPRYIFFAEEILDAFAGSLIINVVRDPRDVMLSQKNKWRRRFLGAKNIPFQEAFRAWVNYHPYMISKLWVSAVRTAERFEKNPRFMNIKFEDFLQNPELVATEMCEFLNVDFEDVMLDIPQVGSSSGIDQPHLKGIDPVRSGAWLRGGLTPLEIDICQRVARTEINRNGYVSQNFPVGRPLRWVSALSFALKAGLALLLNIRRTKNLPETIKRRLVEK